MTTGFTPAPGNLGALGLAGRHSAWSGLDDAIVKDGKPAQITMRLDTFIDFVLNPSGDGPAGAYLEIYSQEGAGVDGTAMYWGTPTGITATFEQLGASALAQFFSDLGYYQLNANSNAMGGEHMLAVNLNTGESAAIRVTPNAGADMEVAGGANGALIAASGNSNIIAIYAYEPGFAVAADRGAFIEFQESNPTNPAAGGVNTARLYARDNGAGKTQLCVVFNTGAVQVLATQP